MKTAAEQEGKQEEKGFIKRLEQDAAATPASAARSLQMMAVVP